MHINLRNPATQKGIIIGALLFGVVYAYIDFVYLPRRELTTRLIEDYKKESELLARGKRVAANYQTVQDDYARLMQSWDIAQELLPTQKEMEGLLKAVTLEGQRRDVSFLLFKPLDPIEKPYYWENPIQVKTLSNYHDLGEFLSAVASMDRIVNINGLHLSAFRTNKGRAPYSVEAEFTVSIYIFKDLGTATTVAADPGKGAAKAPTEPAEGKDSQSKQPPKSKKDGDGGTKA
jgi:type IV pilus assembly protein PilO